MHYQKGWIALSGGLDSVVLTHFLKMHFSHLSLHAIHINHQLQSNAFMTEQHCAQFCEQLNLPLEIIHIQVTPHKNEGLEAAARRLRYQAFSRYIQPKDALITAHHQDDQAETLLLQLLRGAGLRGAAAMGKIQPFAQGYLLRPLLTFSRGQLKDYANFYQLKWIDDPSNTNQQFDRNFLRHTIMPLLQQRWPKTPAILARFAQHCAEQNTLLENLAAEDTQYCTENTHHGLSINKLQSFPLARRQNILRYKIRAQGLPVPAQHFLYEIEKTLFTAKEGANPIVQWPGAQCRRFKGNLFILPHPYQRELILTDQEKQWCAQHLSQLNLHSPAIKIAFRSGGEKFQPLGKLHHYSLKNLFQQWQIPPWQRDKIPLLFFNHQLIAIVGYAISHNYTFFSLSQEQ